MQQTNRILTYEGLAMGAIGRWRVKTEVTIAIGMLSKDHE
jgi:hypothetical protein